MALSIEGTILCDAAGTTSITIHDEVPASEHGQKHDTSKSFKRDGDAMALGGRENVLLQITGILRSVSGGLSDEAQKKKLTEWASTKTTVYMRGSLENDTSCYYGFNTTISGQKYMAMKILHHIYGTVGQELQVTLKLEEVT